jgi:hypothetical protein
MAASFSLLSGRQTSTIFGLCPISLVQLHFHSPLHAIMHASCEDIDQSVTYVLSDFYCFTPLVVKRTTLHNEGHYTKFSTMTSVFQNVKKLAFTYVLHGLHCRAPLHKGCPKHQGHKRDPGVTLGTCGASGEKAQVILVWVRAPGVGNASHPRRLRVMRERP